MNCLCFEDSFSWSWTLTFQKKCVFMKALRKWWKMLFISSWNLLSFKRYLNSCPDCFGHVRKWLDKKAKVNFKIYNVIAWETNNSIHILPNILRSKGNHTMKFGQLLGCNVRNSFLQKSCRKWGWETSSRPLWFLKKLQ